MAFVYTNNDRSKSGAYWRSLIYRSFDAIFVANAVTGSGVYDELKAMYFGWLIENRKSGE